MEVKRLLLLLLCCCFTVLLCACDGGYVPVKSDTSSQASSTVQESSLIAQTQSRAESTETSTVATPQTGDNEAAIDDETGLVTDTEASGVPQSSAVSSAASEISSTVSDASKDSSSQATSSRIVINADDPANYS